MCFVVKAYVKLEEQSKLNTGRAWLHQKGFVRSIKMGSIDKCEKQIYGKGLGEDLVLEKSPATWIVQK